MSFFDQDNDEEQELVLTVRQLKAKRQREIAEEFWSDPCWTE